MTIGKKDPRRVPGWPASPRGRRASGRRHDRPRTYPVPTIIETATRSIKCPRSAHETAGHAAGATPPARPNLPGRRRPAARPPGEQRPGGTAAGPPGRSAGRMSGRDDGGGVSGPVVGAGVVGRPARPAERAGRRRPGTGPGGDRLRGPGSAACRTGRDHGGRSRMKGRDGPGDGGTSVRGTSGGPRDGRAGRAGGGKRTGASGAAGVAAVEGGERGEDTVAVAARVEQQVHERARLGGGQAGRQ